MPTNIVNDSSQSPLTSSNIKVAAARVDVAPFAGSPVWDKKEGWLPLGMLNPGSLKFDFPKEKYDSKSGSPSTIKKRFIVGHEGKVDFTLEEVGLRERELALGHNAGTAVVLETGSTDSVASVTLGPDGGVISMVLVGAGGFTYVPVAGDVAEIVCTDPDMPGGSDNRKVYGRVQSYTAATKTVVFEHELDFPPIAADPVGFVNYMQHAIGGNFFKDWQARIILSATDGSVQVVHLLKVNITTGYQIDPKDGKSAIMLPVSMECIGLNRTLGGRKQVVLAYHYEKPRMEL